MSRRVGRGAWRGGLHIVVGVCVSGMNAVLGGWSGEYCSGWVCRRVGRGSGGGVFTSGDTYVVGEPACGHLCVGVALL